MDRGIIALFKSQYKGRFLRLALDRNSQGADNMYKIDQRQAMHLAKAAWEAVTPQTIANCWRHVGLVPQYHIPPVPPPLPMPNLYIPPIYPAYQPYMHPLPPPPLAPEAYNLAYHNNMHHQSVYPGIEQVFDQLNFGLLTEGPWTDQEIVQQIIQEREDGFMGEEEEDYDLEDFYEHHNPHI
jgi:hypothetical protein